MAEALITNESGRRDSGPSWVRPDDSESGDGTPAPCALRGDRGRHDQVPGFRGTWAGTAQVWARRTPRQAGIGDSPSSVTFASSRRAKEAPKIQRWESGAGGQKPQLRPWR
jgi:hypothetical protein